MSREEFVESQDFHFGLDMDEIALAADPACEQLTAPNRPKSRSNGSSKRKRNSSSKASLAEKFIKDGSNDEEINWDPNNGLPHTGKWPLEEEKFAYKLIRDFEAGALEDCPEGTTLRSYLAKTLRCAPMRVSKKFAGKCIGSKAFARKTFDPSESSSNSKGMYSSLLITRKRPQNIDEDSEDDLSSNSSSSQDLNEMFCSSTSDGGSSDCGSSSPRFSPNSRRRLSNPRYQNFSTDTLASDLTHRAGYRRSLDEKASIIKEVFPIPPLAEALSAMTNNAVFEPVYGFYDTEERNHPHIIELDTQYDEWHRALSYFNTDEGFTEGAGSMKRTQSTVSLMF